MNVKTALNIFIIFTKNYYERMHERPYEGYVNEKNDEYGADTVLGQKENRYLSYASLLE